MEASFVTVNGVGLSRKSDIDEVRLDIPTDGATDVYDNLLATVRTERGAHEFVHSIDASNVLDVAARLNRTVLDGHP